MKQSIKTKTIRIRFTNLNEFYYKLLEQLNNLSNEIKWIKWENIKVKYENEINEEKVIIDSFDSMQQIIYSIENFTETETTHSLYFSLSYYENELQNIDKNIKSENEKEFNHLIKVLYHF